MRIVHCGRFVHEITTWNGAHGPARSRVFGKRKILCHFKNRVKETQSSINRQQSERCVYLRLPNSKHVPSPAVRLLSVLDETRCTDAKKSFMGNAIERIENIHRRIVVTEQITVSRAAASDPLGIVISDKSIRFKWIPFDAIANEGSQPPSRRPNSLFI